VQIDRTIVNPIILITSYLVVFRAIRENRAGEDISLKYLKNKNK
jgi:hypothetical protein